MLIRFVTIIVAIHTGCSPVAHNESRKGKTMAGQSIHIHKALQSREGLLLKNNTRKLYTSIPTIEAFDAPYQTSTLSLNVVIREKLHTTIVVQQSENVLESMDGSLFPLPAEVSAEELTDQLVTLIGGMFYGRAEVELLQKEIQQK